MNKDAILFAMANPVPEIMPDLAKGRCPHCGKEPVVRFTKTR